MDLETPFSDEVGDDEFIADFMSPDIKFKSETEELMNCAKINLHFPQDMVSYLYGNHKYGKSNPYNDAIA